MKSGGCFKFIDGPPEARPDSPRRPRWNPGATVINGAPEAHLDESRKPKSNPRATLKAPTKCPFQ
eukprot:2319312-Karenia_brevis.AAC.1